MSNDRRAELIATGSAALAARAVLDEAIEARKTAILAAYSDGLTIAEISDLTGLSPQMVHKLLRGEGADLRRRGPQTRKAI